MHSIMEIRTFEWRLRGFIVVNLEEINQHKEGHYATIISLYSLPVVRFTLLDVGSYNFVAFMLERMYSSIIEAIWKTPSWMRMTIRVAVIAVHVGFY